MHYHLVLSALFLGTDLAIARPLPASGGPPRPPPPARLPPVAASRPGNPSPPSVVSSPPQNPSVASVAYPPPAHPAPAPARPAQAQPPPQSGGWNLGNRIQNAGPVELASAVGGTVGGGMAGIGFNTHAPTVGWTGVGLATVSGAVGAGAKLNNPRPPLLPVAHTGGQPVAPPQQPQAPRPNSMGSAGGSARRPQFQPPAVPEPQRSYQVSTSSQPHSSGAGPTQSVQAGVPPGRSSQSSHPSLPLPPAAYRGEQTQTASSVASGAQPNAAGPGVRQRPAQSSSSLASSGSGSSSGSGGTGTTRSSGGTPYYQPQGSWSSSGGSGGR